MSSSRFAPSALTAGLFLAAVATLPATNVWAADVSDDAIVAAVQDTVEQQATADPAPQLDASEIECMAKVVLHEAGNQPRDGQVAVAQTLVNRLAAKRFGGSICAVANQPGQFFNTAAYNPDRDGGNWMAALAVARAVLSGDAEPVAPGAMFFRGATRTASVFFRSRQRVASIGAHVFYR